MRQHKHPKRESGFSIVELLVGVAIGLFVIGGALKLFADYVGNNRRLVLETKVNQDMRAAADLIARDLRRAGYWGNSTGGVVTTNASPVPAVSPYASVTPTSIGVAGSSTTYSYSQGTEDNALTAATENFGFRLNAGSIEYLLGGSWQSITDTGTVTMNSFSVTPAHSCISLQQYCPGSVSAGCSVCTLALGTLDANGCPTSTCAGAGLTGCPRLTVRRFNISMQGTSATDSAVVRNLQETVRVRNEQFTGACS